MKTKATANNFIANTSFIPLYDDEWLEKQRVAGKVAARCLSMLEQLVKEGTTKTLLELDALAEEFIWNSGCIPTFKNYKSFPNSVCISVNKQLVHGIPTDYVLQSGDLVSFDLGATEKESGAIGDTALTMICGEPKSTDLTNLISATQEALYKSISKIKPGERLGVIGETIYETGRQHSLSVVANFGGHSTTAFVPHTQPFVSNKDTSNNGIRFANGLNLCIEPLFVIGNSNETKKGNDGWTIECRDYCAHFEHTVFIHDGKVEVLTLRNDEVI